MRSHPVRSLLSSITALALAAGLGLTMAPSASAATVDGATAKGRATGSGKWGYVGQFGQLNVTSKASAGQFALPYAIDVNGETLSVTDSGLASWENGNKAAGHTVQTFTHTAEPGSAGHGDYLGNGQYNIVNTKSSVADPADLVEPLALKALPESSPRGPRGVDLKADGTLSYGVYEAGTPASNPSIYTFANATLQTQLAETGTSVWREPNYTAGSVQLDSDSAGNTYTAVSTGVTINAPDGTFLSSMGGYFDADGVDLLSTISWATRATSVPLVNNNPQFIGEVYGLSVVDQGDKVAVYVGEAGSYYQPDPSIHFPNGTGTAQNLNRGSITKFLVSKSGGVKNDRWNPAGWKWTLDTSFGNGGVFYPGGDTLTSFFGRYFFVGQTVFGLEADTRSNTLYYALNGATTLPAMGALDLSTGRPKTAPGPVNTPSTQQDSSLSYVRGLAVDDRGLVYATSQNTTSLSNSRAIVQIFGKTPSSIEGTAEATPSLTNAVLSWDESAVGYQQPDLLDYTVKYRKVGTTAWETATPDTTTATSTSTQRTLHGLQSATAYEAVITPWNEAGSGDPAYVTFATEQETPELSLVKTGNGAAAPTNADAVTVAAGSAVSFAYTVTNTGNVTLSGVSVADDQIAVLTAPAGFDGTLAPHASVTFTATGPVAAGAYKNTATATSKEGASASAVWHGFGATQGLSIAKKGAGAIATTEDTALQLPAGSTVDFEYIVTNLGNVPATGVTVSDNKIAELTAPAGFDGTLAPQASVTFTASGPIDTGAYKNTATATAEGTSEATTQWNAVGTTAKLSLVKRGNGLEAPTSAEALHVSAGSQVDFSYVVTNTGTATLHGVSVSDDKVSLLTAPAGFDGTLAPQASVAFTASGPVAAGTYKNTATATSKEGASASAVWHGFGEQKPTVPPTVKPTPSASSSPTPSKPTPSGSPTSSGTPTAASSGQPPALSTDPTSPSSETLPETGANGSALTDVLWVAGVVGLAGAGLVLMTRQRRKHG
ncbi:hypothetical protein [Galactobacter sp.]|uniref:DUF7507 domain-containing protein n=1 Tax=Galactobacter sp. TaxID=2676125 RepID=UPI0025C5E511|nr:hypothetical protein [Galactobacter sp.]